MDDAMDDAPLAATPSDKVPPRHVGPGMRFTARLRHLLVRQHHGDLATWKEDGGSAQARCNHVVQFYAGPFPAADVASFVRAGLAQGESAIVVATPEHAKALRRRLAGLGPVTYLDAEDTLHSFLVHGRPDAIRFSDTVGRAVRDVAAQGNGRVRAFGEMVVLLCERGEPEAAAELEALWTRLGERQALTLLCSYPTGAFSGRSRGHGSKLGALHTHVTT